MPTPDRLPDEVADGPTDFAVGMELLGRDRLLCRPLPSDR